MAFNTFNKRIIPLRVRVCIEVEKVLFLNQKLFSSMKCLEDNLLAIFNLDKSKLVKLALLEATLNTSIFYNKHLKELMDTFFGPNCGNEKTFDRGLFALDAIGHNREYVSKYS